VTDYKQYVLDIVKAAKNDTVSVTMNKKNSITEDAGAPPKSRRKNAKYLKEVDETEKSGVNKRESLEDGPDNTSYTLQNSSNQQVASGKMPALAAGTTSFSILPAVPDTTEKMELNKTASIEETRKESGDLVPVVNSSSSDVETTIASIINDDSISNETSTETMINEDNATEVTTTISLTTTNPSVSDLISTPPDYPTYLSTQWTLLYTATTSFSAPDLSPASMFTALKMMVSGGANSSIFESYYEHNTGGHIVDKCDNTCWRQQLCTVTNLIQEELQDCLNDTGKDGFFEVDTAPTTLANTPTQRTGAMFGGGDNDPDLNVHGDSDHSHDHDDDGQEDHTHVDHAKSDVEHQDDLHHDHDKDGQTDHDHIDHAEHFPVANGKESVTKQKLEDISSDLTSRAVAIFFGVLAVAIVALAAGMGYKKYRDNRYRNQEFLLTDAVFRYDGYSQLDDA